MKKRIGSCFVLFIFLVIISLWKREEGKEEGAKERVREAADEFHGEDKGSTTENKESIQRVKDERDSIYEPAAHAYEEIRSLYHLDYGEGIPGCGRDHRGNASVRSEKSGKEA